MITILYFNKMKKKTKISRNKLKAFKIKIQNYQKKLKSLVMTMGFLFQNIRKRLIIFYINYKVNLKEAKSFY